MMPATTALSVYMICSGSVIDAELHQGDVEKTLGAEQGHPPGARTALPTNSAAPPA